MRAAKVALAFLAGAWLYYAAVVFVGGTLAALSVPPAYFEFFGRQNLSFALAVLSLFAWALPVAILVAAGYIAAKRLLPGSGHEFPYAITLGMLASAAYWLWSSEVGFRSLPLVSWWSAPSAMAPWVGAALGVWLIRHSKVEVPNADA